VLHPGLRADDVRAAACVLSRRAVRREDSILDPWFSLKCYSPAGCGFPHLVLLLEGRRNTRTFRLGLRSTGWFATSADVAECCDGIIQHSGNRSVLAFVSAKPANLRLDSFLISSQLRPIGAPKDPR
jgi:hypothetical protein